MAELKLIQHTALQLFQNSDLASATNGSYKFGTGSGLVTSTNILDNTANLYVEANLQVLLGSFNPAGTPPYLVFGFLWSTDGTNFPDPQSAGAPPAGTPLWSIGINAGSSAKIITIPRIPLMPLKGIPFIGNLSGSTLASTGNSASITPAGYTVI